MSRAERRAETRQTRAAISRVRRTVADAKTDPRPFRAEPFRVPDPRSPGRFYIVTPGAIDHAAVDTLPPVEAAAALLGGGTQGSRFLATHPSVADALDLAAAILASAREGA